MSTQQKIDAAQDYLDHAFDDDRTPEVGMTLAFGAGLLAAAQAMLELAGALKESDEQIDTWSKELHTKIPTPSDLLVYVSGLLGRAVIRDNLGALWVLTGTDSETYVQDIDGSGWNSAVWLSGMRTECFPMTIIDGMDMVTAQERIAADGKN